MSKQSSVDLHQPSAPAALHLRARPAAGRRAAVLVLLALASLLLGQCGGSPERSTPAATPEPAAAPTPDKSVSIVNGAFNPKHLPVSKGQKPWVQWENQDEVGYSLDFNREGWPFEEPPHIILVPAHGKSEVLRVWSGVPNGAYSYEPRKAGLYAPSSGPPDPPQVSVGD